MMTGSMDIFFANGAEIPSLKKTGPRFWNRLYRNLGDWRFEDVTESQGLQGERFSMGAVAGDFDNDGRTTCLCLESAQPSLPEHSRAASSRYRRKRVSGTRPWSVAAAWIDYDRDGWLDLFVVNYLDWNPDGSISAAIGRRVYESIVIHGNTGLPNRLYRNRGDGTFEDVSERCRHFANTSERA